MLVKPCAGEFSEEVRQTLQQNTDRAQWRAHRCGLCGQEVEAEQKHGKWLPAQHWPSIRYVDRNRRGNQRKVG